MKHKLNRYFLCIALLLHLISVMTGTVSANADFYEFDPDHSCSISVALAEGIGKTPVVGAEVTVYRVADIMITEDGFGFDYCNGFVGCNFVLDDLEEPSLSIKLLQYANTHGITGITDISNNAGYVSFAGLKQGLYLVAQTKTVEGFTAFSPFLTYLPITLGTSWVYDVDATPKIDIDRVITPPPSPNPPDYDPEYPTKPSDGTDYSPDDSTFRSITVRKVWNDDGEGRSGSVTVRLMNANGVYDEVVLSESNGWSYTWYSLDYYENWYVQEANVPSGYTATYYEDGDLFTVVNTATLAQTGQLKWPIPILGGCGLLLVFTGFILKNAGRKQADDQ